MYTIVAHYECAAHAFGLFDTKEEADKALDGLGSSRGPIDEFYYLTVTPLETGEPLQEWWDAINGYEYEEQE